jgi:hypothetical protein
MVEWRWRVHCILQVNYGMTWNYSLFVELGQVVAMEQRATWLLGGEEQHGGTGYAPHAGLDCWSPNINLNRDPRWGESVQHVSTCVAQLGRYYRPQPRGSFRGSDGQR